MIREYLIYIKIYVCLCGIGEKAKVNVATC